jgi:hypothetical protein
VNRRLARLGQGEGIMSGWAQWEWVRGWAGGVGGATQRPVNEKETVSSWGILKAAPPAHPTLQFP